MRFLAALALPLMAAVLLSGCRGHGGGDDAQVRLINALPSRNELSVAINGKTVMRRSHFGDSTGFVGVKPGRYGYSISDNYGPITRGDLSARAHDRYAVVVAPGRRQGEGAGALNVPMMGEIPRGKVAVTFVQAGEVGTSVDLLLNNVVGDADVRLAEAPHTLVLTEGNYELKANAAGDPYTTFAEASLRAASGHTYLVVLTGRRDVTSLSLRVYDDR